MFCQKYNLFSFRYFPNTVQTEKYGYDSFTFSLNKANSKIYRYWLDWKFYFTVNISHSFVFEKKKSFHNDNICVIKSWNKSRNTPLDVIGLYAINVLKKTHQKRQSESFGVKIIVKQYIIGVIREQRRDWLVSVTKNWLCFNTFYL